VLAWFDRYSGKDDTPAETDEVSPEATAPAR
jgi:hypothetical protein